MKICPLGGVQDLARIPARILRSLRRRRIVNASKLSEESEIEDVFPHRSSRREFLRYVAVGAGLLSGVALGVFLPQNVLKKRRRKFRPPGMPDSDLAAALCVRCGNCMDVCPTKILAIQSEPVGGLEVGLPQLTIGGPGVYCLDDCNTCGVACPSGAIAGLPLDEKRDWKIGLARLELDLCLHTWDRECGICRRECPRGAVSMEWSQEWYTQIPVIDKKLCNGCGACIGMCPGTNTWEVEGDPATPVRRALEVKPVKESS